MPHVCPWWGGYFIDNPIRRLFHNPVKIVGPYVKPSIAYLQWIQGWELGKAADHVMRYRSCDPYLDAIGLAGEDRKRKE